MKRMLALVGCILSMQVHAGAAPEPRWAAHSPFDAIGPVKSLVRTNVFNPLPSYQLKHQAELTFHGNGRMKSYSSYKNNSSKLDFYEKYDERGVIVERFGMDYKDRMSRDDIVVATETWTVTIQGKSSGIWKEETTRYSDGFERVIRKTTKRGKTELVYEYSYDTQGRLEMICILADGRRIPRNTVYYDGVKREFKTNYFVKYNGSPRRAVTGHEEIEIFDNDISIYLIRRQRLTGDRKDPETIEEAEAEVETIEYLFDSHGNEIRQTNYWGGAEYVSFNTEYSEFDRFNNWLHRSTTLLTRDGEEKQYSEETRQINYFE